MLGLLGALALRLLLVRSGWWRVQVWAGSLVLSLVLVQGWLRASPCNRRAGSLMLLKLVKWWLRASPCNLRAGSLMALLLVSAKCGLFRAAGPSRWLV